MDADSAGLSPPLRALLHLSFATGLGPVLITRLIDRFGGDATAAVHASVDQLRSIHGIGELKGHRIAASLAEAGKKATEQALLAREHNITILAKGQPGYPDHLAVLPDSPTILYVRGTLHSLEEDRFPVAIVGSRQCTAYGLEQAQFFGSSLARAGLTIVSGGARGIDSAAHRGALAAGGRTIAVLGCGLLHVYPPENADLFNQIATQGAVVSELPLDCAPQAENFPARNRIISGMSLGTLVIEAGEQSGALITARVATEEHGREVFALPGRVDSPASRGTLSLLKRGGAHLVTEPADIINGLEQTAHHVHRGSFAARFPAQPASLFAEAQEQPTTEQEKTFLGLSDIQKAILLPLEPSGLTFDQLHEATGIEVVALRRELSLLELNRRIGRQGSTFVTLKRRL